MRKVVTDKSENPSPPETLEELLDRINKAATDKEQVSLDDILDEVGDRSFGPLMLLAGLVILAPIVGDIPGVPSIMGVFVILTASQMLFQQEHFWLPDWLLNQQIDQEKLCKGLEWLQSPAYYFDRLMRRRLEFLVTGISAYIIAVVCILISLALPAMEFIPFSANFAGLAISAFGLSLIAYDGLVAAFAYLSTLSTIGFILYQVM
ncbi:MAG: exopolysaccharide biosynthesis protein [Balneolaceae bacterium]|nr:exopolysaccharide biosynthesis protein [Balneolaceae bacterium]